MLYNIFSTHPPTLKRIIIKFSYHLQINHFTHHFKTDYNKILTPFT